jgi:hypothetical protein
VDSVELAVLESLADPRIAGSARSLGVDELEAEIAAVLPGASWRGVEEQGLAENWGDRVQLVVDGSSTLDELRASRELEWATQTVAQGEVLAGFGAYCRDELDDVEVLDEQPTRLELQVKRERSALELRASLLFCDRLTTDGPLLLLTDLGDGVVQRFLDDEALRSAVAVYDLARLQKVNAVRSSAFVYFEWFLRDAYGVKLLPTDVFTQGLVDRGIISLGMG